jgi:hypothetical protein
LQVHCAPTIMKSEQDKAALARFVLGCAAPNLAAAGAR